VPRRGGGLSPDAYVRRDSPADGRVVARIVGKGRIVEIMDRKAFGCCHALGLSYRKCAIGNCFENSSSLTKLVGSSKEPDDKSCRKPIEAMIEVIGEPLPRDSRIAIVRIEEGVLIGYNLGPILLKIVSLSQACLRYVEDLFKSTALALTPESSIDALTLTKNDFAHHAAFA
jgi:hypothetical protein